MIVHVHRDPKWIMSWSFPRYFDGVSDKERSFMGVKWQAIASFLFYVDWCLQKGDSKVISSRVKQRIGHMDHAIQSRACVWCSRFNLSRDVLLGGLDRKSFLFNITLQDDDEDFQPSQVPFSPNKRRRTSASTAEDSTDEQHALTCPICMEPMHNSGAHAITSLKCGHLFCHQ